MQFGKCSAHTHICLVLRAVPTAAPPGPNSAALHAHTPLQPEAQEPHLSQHAPTPAPHAQHTHLHTSSGACWAHMQQPACTCKLLWCYDAPSKHVVMQPKYPQMPSPRILYVARTCQQGHVKAAATANLCHRLVSHPVLTAAAPIKNLFGMCMIDQSDRAQPWHPLRRQYLLHALRTHVKHLLMSISRAYLSRVQQSI